jgi:signal transduction histidine kinase
VDLRSHAEVAAALHAPSSVVRQVMLNLLVNATKAAGDGGWVSATLAADAQRLRFCVCNSGQALDAAALEAAITAESGNDPRGFGLWVCREIATQFGGGFAALPPAQAGGCLPAAAGAPLATALQFWIPNQASHAQPAVD